MKNTLKSELKLLGAILFVGICSTASAQVATGVSSSVNSKLNAFLYVVTGAASILFTYCGTMAGYKFATTENTKFSELRGLLIGGVLAGSAASIAYALIS